MKILLANLPWKCFGRTGVRAGSRWPHLKGATERDYLPFPFFLAYAASLLSENRFTVRLIDAIAEEMSYRSFLHAVESFKPDLFVCETSTVTLEHDLGVLRRIDSRIPIVLCGPDVNIRKPLFLKSHEFVDYVIVGEYELTLLELAKHIRAGKDLKSVSGLIYRHQGAVVSTPGRPLADLDDLSWPLRQTLPMHRYNDTPGDMPIPSVQMLASRGCPYKCKFCLWPQVMYQSNSYRTRNIVDVIDEMEFLVKEMHFKSVYFDDDTFNCGKERMLALCEQIKKRKLRVPWAIMARADLMTEEILERMADAGLFAVKYGVESATQSLLDGINKNMNLSRTQEIIAFTKRLGIRTHLTFTFGLPGETKESIRKTIDMALRFDPTTLQFSIATPFPGTAFYAEMKKKGHILSETWSEYDGNHKSVLSLKDVTRKDLERAIRTAYKEWNLHIAARNPFRKASYYLPLVRSLRKYGFITTAVKIFRFLINRTTAFYRETVFFRRELSRKIDTQGLKVGRLMVIFDRGSLNLYWDGMKLTRGAGFMSSFSLDGKSGLLPQDIAWNFEKRSNSEIALTRRYAGSSLLEEWKITVIDEKQIDWAVDMNSLGAVAAVDGKVMLLLTGRYRIWVDSWGEGRLYPVSDSRNVPLRNSRSEFIGLRGRKKLRGQLPTFFLDLSGNVSPYLPAIRNDDTVFGARALEVEVKYRDGDNGREKPAVQKLFSGRIKIVEEDFSKRKSSRR